MINIIIKNFLRTTLKLKEYAIRIAYKTIKDGFF